MKNITIEKMSTILAALRYYQAAGLTEHKMRSSDLNQIATNNGSCKALSDTEIDDLCYELAEPNIVDSDASIMLRDLDNPAELNTQYETHITTQDKVWIDVRDKNKQSVLGVTLLISNGVPCVHIDNGNDPMDFEPILIAHSAHDGLVLSPATSQLEFTKAPVDKFSDNNSLSVLLSGQ